MIFLFCVGLLLGCNLSHWEGSYQENHCFRCWGEGLWASELSRQRSCLRGWEYSARFVKHCLWCMHMPSREQHTLQCPYLRLWKADLSPATGIYGFENSNVLLAIFSPCFHYIGCLTQPHTHGLIKRSVMLRNKLLGKWEQSSWILRWIQLCGKLVGIWC